MFVCSYVQMNGVLNLCLQMGSLRNVTRENITLSINSINFHNWYCILSVMLSLYIQYICNFWKNIYPGNQEGISEMICYSYDHGFIKISKPIMFKEVIFGLMDHFQILLPVYLFGVVKSPKSYTIFDYIEYELFGNVTTWANEKEFLDWWMILCLYDQ